MVTATTLPAGQPGGAEIAAAVLAARCRVLLASATRQGRGAPVEVLDGLRHAPVGTGTSRTRRRQWARALEAAREGRPGAVGPGELSVLLGDLEVIAARLRAVTEVETGDAATLPR